MDKDTGFCEKCGIEFTREERRMAYATFLNHGFGYMHQWCFDLTYQLFITRKEAEKFWAHKIKENPNIV